MTKVDSQVLLPLNYFPELDRSVQHRSGCGPVVWQPLLAGLMNRNRSIGATRALTSMRCFSYPGIFALNLMCVTCYSAPLMQYVKMGLHHPNYLGEDCMMLAQATISEGQKFFLWFPFDSKAGQNQSTLKLVLQFKYLFHFPTFLPNFVRPISSQPFWSFFG